VLPLPPQLGLPGYKQHPAIIFADVHNLVALNAGHGAAVVVVALVVVVGAAVVVVGAAVVVVGAAVVVVALVVVVGAAVVVVAAVQLTQLD